MQFNLQNARHVTTLVRSKEQDWFFRLSDLDGRKNETVPSFRYSEATRLLFGTSFNSLDYINPTARVFGGIKNERHKKSVVPISSSSVSPPRSDELFSTLNSDSRAANANRDRAAANHNHNSGIKPGSARSSCIGMDNWASPAGCQWWRWPKTRRRHHGPTSHDQHSPLLNSQPPRRRAPPIYGS